LGIGSASPNPFPRWSPGGDLPTLPPPLSSVSLVELFRFLGPPIYPAKRKIIVFPPPRWPPTRAAFCFLANAVTLTFVGYYEAGGPSPPFLLNQGQVPLFYTLFSPLTPSRKGHLASFLPHFFFGLFPPLFQDLSLLGER